MDSWVADTYGWVHSPRNIGDWRSLLNRYGEEEASPLAEIFAVARSNRCQTVIEENRYVDPDYRSEYSEFWSKRFEGRPAFSRRLHFFATRIPDGEIHRLRSDRAAYLGYAVLKPVGKPDGSGRVGRTVLVPPRRLRKARLVLATDHVSLFGTRLTVRGAPFYQQDGEFLRCAHAAVWMCHYHAHLRDLVARQPTARLAAFCPAGVSEERDLPSPGLSLSQIQTIFAETGQPALFYGLRKMPDVEGIRSPPELDEEEETREPGLWDTRLFSVVCRYLNAGFPVMIGSEDHAFVIFGWYREGGRIRFVVADDQIGPYQVIGSPFTHKHAPWQCLMVPLPPKVYLTGEAAESAAQVLLRATGSKKGTLPEWEQLVRRIEDGQISFRTFLRSNHEYKAAVGGQRRGEETTRALRLARLSHWVWVVEAHDRMAREGGRPSVLAECVFDSTSGDKEPKLSALSLPGLSIVVPPDDGKPESQYGPTDRWRSQLDLAEA
jgi:hypothetical protein